MRYWYKLDVLVLALLILILMLTVSGCATVSPKVASRLERLAPDYVTVGITHESTAGYGPHSWPIGDNGATPESTHDAIEGSLRWERGRYWAETSAGYVVHSVNREGGDLIFTARAGLRFRIGE